MIGVLFSVVAGILISLQNVFNARVSERTGAWATTSLVLGLGLVCSLPVFYSVEQTSLFNFGDVDKIFLFSGVFGVGIVFCLMRGVSLIGPAYAISIALISQILIAFVINTGGWFGFDASPLSITKLLGIALLIGGVLVYKLEKPKEEEQEEEAEKMRA
ncbi:transporter family-2 protein [Halobacillus dabanensis]|uniref:Transporter family-2 protein n=1 Tax=Halobacillus dabanensis TaxID=240302 RepID=A0A1I3Q0P9_HALDA|nr:DMT family transporter [Halobacillus dabanensis]SFJ26726.1 transporter family-2 protein [Halobacillus dabanensis]